MHFSSLKSIERLPKTDVIDFIFLIYLNVKTTNLSNLFNVVFFIKLNELFIISLY
jgi:hypothetical protein